MSSFIRFISPLRRYGRSAFDPYSFAENLPSPSDQNVCKLVAARMLPPHPSIALYAVPTKPLRIDPKQGQEKEEELLAQEVYKKTMATLDDPSPKKS